MPGQRLALTRHVVGGFVLLPTFPANGANVCRCRVDAEWPVTPMFQGPEIVYHKIFLAAGEPAAVPSNAGQEDPLISWEWSLDTSSVLSLSSSGRLVQVPFLNVVGRVILPPPATYVGMAGYNLRLPRGSRTPLTALLPRRLEGLGIVAHIHIVCPRVSGSKYEKWKMLFTVEYIV
jgi:hypothetical protein